MAQVLVTSISQIDYAIEIETSPSGKWVLGRGYDVKFECTLKIQSTCYGSAGKIWTAKATFEIYSDVLFSLSSVTKYLSTDFKELSVITAPLTLVELFYAEATLIEHNKVVFHMRLLHHFNMLSSLEQTAALSATLERGAWVPFFLLSDNSGDQVYVQEVEEAWKLPDGIIPVETLRWAGYQVSSHSAEIGYIVSDLNATPSARSSVYARLELIDNPELYTVLDTYSSVVCNLQSDDKLFLQAVQYNSMQAKASSIKQFNCSLSENSYGTFQRLHLDSEIVSRVYQENSLSGELSLVHIRTLSCSFGQNNLLYGFLYTEGMLADLSNVVSVDFTMRELHIRELRYNTEQFNFMDSNGPLLIPSLLAFLGQGSSFFGDLNWGYRYKSNLYEKSNFEAAIMFTEVPLNTSLANEITVSFTLSSTVEMSLRSSPLRQVSGCQWSVLTEREYYSVLFEQLSGFTADGPDTKAAFSAQNIEVSSFTSNIMYSTTNMLAFNSSISGFLAQITTDSKMEALLASGSAFVPTYVDHTTLEAVLFQVSSCASRARDSTLGFVSLPTIVLYNEYV